MTFESGVRGEDWRSAVIVPLYTGKGERTECKNYKGISFLSVVGKIFAGILVSRVCRVTGGLIDDEQGSFRVGSGLIIWCFVLAGKGTGRDGEERRVK